MSGADRISDLPDPLLIHMLSFLSTIEAVQTCVLSKRWSKLWQYVPSLHFDDEEFFSGIDNGLQDFLRFQLFVNSVLLLCGVSKLDRIYIKSAVLFPHNASAVRMWVNHAIRCNLRAFEFVYYGIRNLHMPQTVFTCASLEDLGFWIDSEEDKEVVMPKYINLPRLKSFWLGGVAVGESFICALVSACPSLEDLTMFECFADSLDICSQNLKSLIINDCIVMNTLLISAPNLKYLCIYFKKETVMGGVRLENMQSLYEVEFCFGSEIGVADIPREFLFLSKISIVTHLKLAGSDAVLKALLEELPNCSTFHNLSHLDISGLCFFDDFDVISHFFLLLPNLESLTLWDKANGNAIEKGSVNLSRGTLASKCLKTIEIRYPKDTDAQELKTLLLASIEHPERVQIILSS